MRWWLIPAVATLPLLGIACSDSASNVTPEQTPKTSRPESRQANAGTFVLTYFTVPGWGYCAKVVPIVNGLEKVYGDRLTFQVKDYKKGDSPELIQKYELGKHGMVITDGEGNKLWSEPSHYQTREGVEKAIKKVLGA